MKTLTLCICSTVLALTAWRNSLRPSAACAAAQLAHARQPRLSAAFRHGVSPTKSIRAIDQKAAQTAIIGIVIDG